MNQAVTNQIVKTRVEHPNQKESEQARDNHIFTRFNNVPTSTGDNAKINPLKSKCAATKIDLPIS